MLSTCSCPFSPFVIPTLTFHSSITQSVRTAVLGNIQVFFPLDICLFSCLLRNEAIFEQDGDVFQQKKIISVQRHRHLFRHVAVDREPANQTHKITSCRKATAHQKPGPPEMNFGGHLSCFLPFLVSCSCLHSSCFKCF